MDTQQLKAKIAFWQNDLPELVSRFPTHIPEVLEAAQEAASRAGPGKWDVELEKHLERAKAGHLDAVKAVVDAAKMALAKMDTPYVQPASEEFEVLPLPDDDSPLEA